MDTLTQRNTVVNDVIDTIISAVHLRHVDRNQINDQTPLQGLGLDSIDILEVVVAVEQKFHLKVQDAEAGKKYFQTIGTIADFVMSGAGRPS